MSNFLSEFSSAELDGNGSAFGGCGLLESNLPSSQGKACLEYGQSDDGVVG
jgi:hypothetical protein